MSKNKEELSPSGKKKLIAVLSLVVAGICLLIGYNVIAGISGVQEKRNLIHNGKVTNGHVFNRDKKYNGVGRNGGWESYSVDYSFTYTDASGNAKQLSTYKAEVSRADYNAYPVNSNIPVAYVASNPSINRPEVSLRKLDAASRYSVAFITALLTLALLTSLKRKFVKPAKSKKYLDTVIFFASLSVAIYLGGSVIARGVISVIQSLLFGA